MEETLFCPAGFRAGGARAGLKASGRDDLAVIVSDRPCLAAAHFTRNRFPGAPITVSRDTLERSARSARGILINSGQANACTGPAGERLARAIRRALAKPLGARPEEIFVASTGVIGHMPSLARIEAALPATLAAAGATPEGWRAAARGIMTTDTREKIASREIRLAGGRAARVLGIAKGSGMIHPNLATMLAFVATDAHLSPAGLRAAFRRAVDRSFHCVTVDGDTSTSDMALLLANGAAGGPALRPGGAEFEAFERALTEVCAALARAIALDGEGATRLVTVRVRGAASEPDARECAMAIARSNLVKCALFGRDPNWGRLACAVGTCGAEYQSGRVVIQIGPICVFQKGRPARFDETAVHDYMASNEEIEIHVDLKAGKSEAVVWTCDLTYDYVKINAEYRT